MDKPEMDAPDSGQGTLRVEPTVVLLPTALSGAREESHPLASMRKLTNPEFSPLPLPHRGILL